MCCPLYENKRRHIPFLSTLGMKKSVFILFMAVLLSSCDQWKAERLVSSFLKENLKEEYDFSKKYNDLDSTFNITDSIVGVMRMREDKNEKFNTPIKYVEGAPTRPLMIERVRLKENDSTTYTMTFYLDKELTRVVAFKEN